MVFKRGDGVTHLYFGIGKVAAVKKECYSIRFVEMKETKSILKDHSALQATGHLWTQEDLDAAKKYIEKQRRQKLWVNQGP